MIEKAITRIEASGIDVTNFKKRGLKMFKKKIGSIVVMISLILFAHSISTISEGATGGMRIIPGENDDFYYEDGTKVPDDIAEQIRNSLQKGGSSRASKEPKQTIKRDESVEITKDEIFSKEHYSLQDFFQLGVLSFYAEAKSRGDAFIELIKKMQNSTARFRITKSKIKAGTPRSAGSSTAVFLPNGYVLTAGHCVRGTEGGKLTNIQVATVDGSTFKAKVVDSSFASSIRVDDWAVLKLLEPYKGPTASIGTCKKFDEVIIMGYPSRFSHDENYRVFQPSPIFFYSAGEKAYAIPFMGRIIGEDKISLTVGSDMIGGCSGGPVFNLKGKVVGIVSGGRRTADSDTEVRFCPVEKVLKKFPELAEASDNIHY